MQGFDGLVKEIDSLTYNARSVLNALIRSVMRSGSSSGYTVTRKVNSVPYTIKLTRGDIYILSQFYSKWEELGFSSTSGFSEALIYADALKYYEEPAASESTSAKSTLLTKQATPALVRHSEMLFLSADNVSNYATSADSMTDTQKAYWLGLVSGASNPLLITNSCPVPVNLRTPVFDSTLSTRHYNQYETYLFPFGYYAMDILGYSGDGTTHSAGGNIWNIYGDTSVGLVSPRVMLGDTGESSVKSRASDGLDSTTWGLNTFAYGDYSTAGGTAVHRAYADSKHQKFIVERDPLLSSYIRMDRLCMQKIFLNLLSNAVKFTPEGGTIEFRIQRLFPQVDGANCVLTVRDNGIGISKEFLPRVFDAFAQEQAPESENAQGTGLGLAIAKRLVNLMGGKIKVEREKGKGTLFSVYLYIDPVRDYSPAPEINGKGAASLQGKNVLLVEDHPLNTELAKTLLEQKGMNVRTAGNGKEAVARFSESAPDFFDAILMDIRMPVMDGLTAARRIRELERSDAQSVPIIAMTANAFDDDIRHCIEAGMNFHIANPINPEELFERLRKYIGR